MKKLACLYISATMLALSSSFSWAQDTDQPNANGDSIAEEGQAQQEDSSKVADTAASATSNNSAGAKKLFFLPVEIDTDSGASNGDAVISRILPTFSIPLSERWRLASLTQMTIADAPGRASSIPGNPEPVAGPSEFGLGDIVTIGFLTPNSSGRLKWGVGAGLAILTASKDVLGSGKWSAGPAIRLGYQSGPWRTGMVAANLKSFSGDADRADVNQLMIRGLVRRDFGDDWYFVYAPIITANWDRDSNQRWLVPLGGGFGRHLQFASSRIDLSMQVYSNVIKPDGAPHSVIRIATVMPIPLR